MSDALCIDLPDVVGLFLSVAQKIQSWDQTFQDQRGLSGARDAGDHRQTAFGDLHGKRLDGMDAVRLHADRPVGKQRFPLRLLSRCLLPGEVSADHGSRIVLNIIHCPFRNDRAAFCSGLGPHLDEPIGLLQDLYVVIHKQHGVAIPDQIVHDTVQADNIGGMQTNRRLIQDVQNARCAVPDRPRQLHPLPFAGGERS